MLKIKQKAPAGALAVLFLIMQQAAFLLVLSLPVQAQNINSSPFNVKIQPLPSPVAGLISVQAWLNAPPDSVRFRVIGSNNDTYQTFVGQKINETNYYFDWQTSDFANGFYHLAVSAIKGDYLAYDEIEVEIKNITSPQSSAPMASGQEEQKDSATYDNDVKKTASTSPEDLLETPDKTKDSSLNTDLTNNENLTTLSEGALSENSVSLASTSQATSSSADEVEQNNNLSQNNLNNPTVEPANASTSPLTATTSIDIASSSSIISSSSKKEVKEPVFTASSSSMSTLEEAGVKATSSLTKASLPAKQIPKNLDIKITAPTNSEQVQGKIILIAQTTAPASAVDFYWQSADLAGDYNIIGSAQADEKKQYWRLAWETDQLANGVYVLQARAKNQSGKIFYSQPLAVSISNSSFAANNRQKEHGQKPTVNYNSQTKPSSAKTNQPRHLSVAVGSTSSSSNSSRLAAKVKTRVKVRDRFVGEKIIVTECKDKDITDINQCWQFLQKQYGAFTPCIGLTAVECSAQLRSSLIISAQQIVSLQRFPQQCVAAGIISLADCEVFLRSQYAYQACLNVGITNKNSCALWLRDKYGPLIKCKALNKKACQNLEQKVVLADFISPRLKEKAKQDLKIIVNKHIVVAREDFSFATSAQIIITNQGRPLATSQEFSRSLSQIFPLRPTKDDKEIKLLVISSADKNKETSLGAVLLFDQDGDGLSDDIERRLGTDPAKKDTDNDGYNDKEEILGGYNPLGSGRAVQELAPIEKAIVYGQALAEPKQSGQLTPALKVLAVQTTTATTSSTSSALLHLLGQALPKQVVSLYIYSSLPIIITVKTDENGNWVYDLDKTLVDGRHEAYVAINNEDGSIAAKSAPFTFFIKGARAASADDFIASEQIAPSASAAVSSQRMVKNYIIAGLAIIICALSIFLFYYHHQQQRNKRAIA